MNISEHNYTDNFFKEGLNSPPELSPTDKNWEDMERLLTPQSKRRSFTLFYAVSGVAAVILIFLSLWLVPEKPDHSDQQAKKNNSAKAKPETEKSTISKPGIVDPRESRRSPDGTLPDKGSNLHLAPFKGTGLSGNTNEPVSVENVSAAPGNLPASGDRSGLGLVKTVTYLSVQTHFSGEFASQRDFATTDTSAANGQALVSDTEIPDNRTPASLGKWALSLAFSPDFNTVNDMRDGNLGTSLGIGVSYKLVKGLSIGTGVYYSKKLYSADKTSYKVTEKPFATWASYSKKIDADCRVIDVPINLSLRISNKINNKFFVSAGMSSYIMLSEKYDFIYNNPSPAFPTGRREYTIRNENKHILNIVNLAIALEKPLSNQVSLVIQPYAKLPLSGIGKGRTDLKSVGLGLGLNYGVKKK
ncbi:hypothetical protein, partial [Daejeonella sp.]|uniref:hypothetical protein n=1 Tax=Daejeonella sp. TaxID=2805397 RepID=UPI0039832D40